MPLRMAGSVTTCWPSSSPRSKRSRQSLPRGWQGRSGVEPTFDDRAGAPIPAGMLVTSAEQCEWIRNALDFTLSRLDEAPPTFLDTFDAAMESIEQWLDKAIVSDQQPASPQAPPGG